MYIYIYIYPNHWIAQATSYHVHWCHLLWRSPRVNVVVTKPLEVDENKTTLWKTNMEPQKGGLEDGFPFQKGDV